MRRVSATASPIWAAWRSAADSIGALLERTDAGGITMAEAFRAFGLDPARLDEAAYPAGRLLGYLEAHIEQGPVLETLGAPVGVVEGIVGQSRIWAEFRGRSGHAGTLPMEGRLDALAAAAGVRAGGRAARPIGRGPARDGRHRSRLRPGRSTSCRGRHGSASMSATRATRSGWRRWRSSVRGPSPSRRVGAWNSSSPGKSTTPAVPADPLLSDLLCQAVVQAGHVPHRLASGAGHDAAVMAAVAPMAMLFLRSPGGVSHHPDERACCPETSSSRST